MRFGAWKPSQRFLRIKARVVTVLLILAGAMLLLELIWLAMFVALTTSPGRP